MIGILFFHIALRYTSHNKHTQDEKEILPYRSNNIQHIF